MTQHVTADRLPLLELRSKHRRQVFYVLAERLGGAAPRQPWEAISGGIKVLPADVELVARQEMERQLETGRCVELIELACKSAAYRGISATAREVHHHADVSHGLVRLVQNGGPLAVFEPDLEPTPDERSTFASFAALGLLADVFADDGYVDPNVPQPE